MGNFYTDVIQKDSRLESTAVCKDLSLLEPVTRAAVSAICATGAWMVTETFRSQARQAMLFAQHATELREVGVHHYGLAADLAKVVDGRPNWQGDFSALGVLAKANFSVWGGDWDNPNLPEHAFRDWDHIQRINVSQQCVLFDGSWYPNDTYVPVASPARSPSAPIPVFERAVLTMNMSGDAVKRLQLALTAAGFPITADGFYGAQTMQAVRNYESVKHLESDGIAGILVQTALGL